MAICWISIAGAATSQGAHGGTELVQVGSGGDEVREGEEGFQAWMRSSHWILHGMGSRWRVWGGRAWSYLCCWKLQTFTSELWRRTHSYKKQERITYDCIQLRDIASPHFALCSMTVKRPYFDTFMGLFKDLSCEAPGSTASSPVGLVRMLAGLNATC